MAYVLLKKPIKLISVLLLPASQREVQSALRSCCRAKPSCIGLVSQRLSQRSAAEMKFKATVHCRTPFTATLGWTGIMGQQEWENISLDTGQPEVKHLCAQGTDASSGKVPNCTHTVVPHLKHAAHPRAAQLSHHSHRIRPEPIWQPQRILAPHTEVQAKPLPISFQVLVYMDTVVQKK